MQVIYYNIMIELRSTCPLRRTLGRIA